MFDKIIVRQTPRKSALLDLGAVAEALLFYGNVHLFLDHRTLGTMVKEIGPANLVYLLENRFLNITFLGDMPATMANSNTGLAILDMGFAGLYGHQGRKKYSAHEIFERALRNTTGVMTISPREKKTIFSAMPTKKLSKYRLGSDSISEGFRNELLNSNFSDLIARESLSARVPDFAIEPKHFFRLEQTSSGFLLNTNLPFSTINDVYQKKVPSSQGGITPELIVSDAFESYCDIALASWYVSEFAADGTSSRLADRRFSDLIGGSERSNDSMSALQELIIPSGKSVREAINSRERSFTEFVRLLSKASKFKEWLRGVNPDAEVASEYLAKVSEGTWLQTLPAKTLRFTVFAGLGAASSALAPEIGLATGLGLSALDAFVVEKMLGGWRPAKFVQGPLTGFLNA